MSAEPIRSADLMKYKLLEDPELLQELQLNPKAVLDSLSKDVTRSIPSPAYISDQWTYRIVVISLGLIVVLSLIGAIYLSAVGKSIPDILTALGAAAVGALAGIFSPIQK
jgi:hypothetical protein